MMGENIKWDGFNTPPNHKAGELSCGEWGEH